MYLASIATMKQLFATAALLFAHAMLGIGQVASAQNIPADPTVVASRIQAQLESRYPLTKTTADGTDVETAGAVVVLRKDKLLMNKVFLDKVQKSAPVGNAYENGDLSTAGFLGAVSKINIFLSGISGKSDRQARSFVTGERVWVTKIAVESEGIVFSLLSNPIDGSRYHATLRFPSVNVHAAEQTIPSIGEVLVADPATFAPMAAAVIAPVVAALPSPPPGAAPAKRDEADELRIAADGGDLAAMYRLGNLLAERGDNVEAARWFRQASDKGHIKATNALGFMYEEGRGVPENYDQASALYLKAMKKGNHDAMVNRAVIFAQGKGVTKDLLQAYVHLLLAVAHAPDQESRNGAVKLKEEVAAKLTKAQISRAQALADKFAKEQIR